MPVLGLALSEAKLLFFSSSFFSAQRHIEMYHPQGEASHRT